MSKPDYNEMAEACAGSNGLVYLTKECLREALREAFAAGLERAADVLTGCDGWIDPNELIQLIAVIRAEKEKTDG